MDKHRECVSEGHCRPRHQSRKNRSRWCKGRVGVEHDWQWVDEGDIPNTSFNRSRGKWGERLGYRRERRVCQSCGRQSYDTRCRCHCGVLFESDGKRVSWLSATFCPACDYMKDWREGRWRGRDCIQQPYKPPCKCESAAASKRGRMCRIAGNRTRTISESC